MNIFASLMGSIPGPELISQLLRASGVKDPKVYAMIDSLVAGGFRTPEIEAIGEHGLHLSAEDNAMLVRTRNHEEELVLVLVRRKVSKELPQPVIHTLGLTAGAG